MIGTTKSIVNFETTPNAIPSPASASTRTINASTPPGDTSPRSAIQKTL